MKKESIKNIFYSVFTYIVIIAIISQIVIFYNLINISNAQNKKIADAIINQICLTIEKKLASTNKLKKKLNQNQIVLDIINSKTDYEKNQNLTKIAETFDNLQVANEDLFYAALFKNETDGIKLTNNMSEQEYAQMYSVYKEYNTAVSQGKVKISGEYCDFFDYKTGELYVCSVLPVFEHDFQNLINVNKGTIVVCTKINAKKMVLEISNLQEVNIKIVNNYNQKFSQISLNDIGKTNLFSNKISQKIDILNTTWEISETLATDETMYAIKMIQILFSIETLFILTFIFVLKRKLEKLVISPVETIVEFLNSYEIASRQRYIKVDSVVEIENIADNINDLLDNIKQITRKLVSNQQTLYETELLNKETSYYALQNQVNPHFLYNALECLRGMALLQDLNEVADIAADISDIMRYTLRNEQTVALNEEIDIAIKYVNIMKARYSNMFQLCVDIPENLKNLQITKMSVQPIAENAFLNGEFFRSRHGILKIKAYKEDEMLKISVYDNGKGFSPLKKEEIEKNLKNENILNNTQKSIGLGNINSRIKLKYGKEYGLQILSQENVYTEIILSFPY